MDLENTQLPGDRLKQKVEKHDLSNGGYYYAALTAQIHKKCNDICLHAFKSSNLSQTEKSCLKNCAHSFLNVNVSSFYSMHSALVLHDMEKDVNAHSSSLHLH